MRRPLAAVATFGRLAELDAKMAHGAIRYCDNVVCVIDEKHAGQDASAVVPEIARDVPVVTDVEEGIRLGAREIVIGATPPGGGATNEVFDLAREGLERGLWIVSGLHDRLSEASELKAWSERIVDLRHRAVKERVATGAAASLTATVILMVASDCGSGKMTAALEFLRSMRARGIDATFVATGQTGMYIAGEGVAIDAVRSDFVAGVVEQLVVEASGHDYVLVEGQGSILHPAYSGVSLALLHGAAPNVLLFCHDVTRTSHAYWQHDIADIGEEIALLETLASYQRPARVVGICAMTRGLDATSAQRAMARLEDRLGLPVASPLDRGLERLVELVV